MTRILHISDIHIRGTTRHQEYVNTITYLLDLQKKSLQADLCVVTGDIWHTKTQGISPESIEILSWFFRELSAGFLGVRVLLGNHDGNLTNLSRQDVITPIISALNLPNVSLWKSSGRYTDEVDSRLRWCVYSPFDKEGWKKVEPDTSSPGLINIGLFHGVVEGAATDSEWRMQHSEAQLTHFRDKYPFVLLGDIHKRQVLETRPDKHGDERGWIAYAGSLIQQNHGETEDKGGLLWDISGTDDWNLQEVVLPSWQPFVTTPWMGTVDQTVRTLLDSQGGSIKGGSRVRVVSSGVDTLRFTDPADIKSVLMNTHQCESVVFKTQKTSEMVRTQPQEGVVGRHSLRGDVSGVVSLFKTWAEAQGVEPGIITKGGGALEQYLTKVRQDSATTHEDVRDVVWVPEVLRFENTFKYREGNRVTFKNLDGVVGLFGSNGSGKSSVVSSLLYGLFGTTERGPIKSGNLIALGQKRCQVQVEFRVGQDLYLVERTTYRQPPKKKKGVVITDDSNTVLNLWKLDPSSRDKVQSLNGDTGPDTDKVIRSLIGTSEDFLLTSFSGQGDITRFLDKGPTQRKAILTRFLDLDLFEKLHSLVKDDVLRLKSQVGTWSEEATKKSVSDLLDQIRDLEETSRSLQEQRNSAAADLLGLSERVIEDGSQLQTLEAELARATARVARDRETWQRFLKTEEDLQRKIQQMPSEEDLLEKSALYSTLAKQVQDLATRVHLEKATLAQQTKAVKTLSQVPCGTQFPECKFIRDSHKASQDIEAQTSLVSTLTQNHKEVVESMTQVGHGSVAALEDLLRLKRELEGVTRAVMSAMERVQTGDLEVQHLKDQIQVLRSRGATVDLLLQKSALEKKIKFLDEEVLVTAEKLGGRRVTVSRLQKDMGVKETVVRDLHALEVLQTALGKTALPAMVLSTEVPALNEELERILLGVVDFKVVLDVDGSGGANTMDIFLEDKAGRRPLEVASGAEQMVASLALRVALYNLTTVPKPDLLVIDEGFGVLDEENLPKITSFLQSLKAWFRVVLVISHVSGVKDAVDKILDVGTDLGYPLIQE